MLVIHLLSSVIFNLFPVPIKPTIVHIPVIIASILYGPKVGAILGALMVIFILVSNSLVLLPSSYLGGGARGGGGGGRGGKTGLILAGTVGSLTNTIFVLGGIFLLFSKVYNGNIQLLLASVISTNSIAEMIISAVLTVTIIPALEKVRK